MASVADSILIKMGLDSSQLQQGLQKSKNEIASTTNAIGTMGAKWQATASMLTRTIIAPIAGFMSLGAVIKSYFSGVAQVAQLTGAYSTKMEEWRKKRAMLARYNKEDIELYKKGREAVTKFQITMDDLSAKLMRSVSPAIKWLIDKLNDFSNWIAKNENNIVRFLTVVAGVITALLIPTFIRMAIALAPVLLPLIKMIAIVGALILIIDDLATYLRGGESLFGAFWKPCIEFAKTAWEWIKELYNLFINSTAFKAFQNIYQNIFKHFINGIKQLWELVKAWFNEFLNGTSKLNALWEVAKGVFQGLGGLLEVWAGIFYAILGGIVALFTGDMTIIKNAWDLVCDGLQNTFKGAFKIIEGAVIHVKNIFETLKETVNKIIDAVMNFGTAIRNALNIDGLIEKVKSGLSNLLPDWVKSSLGIGEGETPETASGANLATAPNVESVQILKAQEKGNVNNNISRNQTFNINSSNPAVASATIRQADQQMQEEDRWIAMASQGAGW